MSTDGTDTPPGPLERIGRGAAARLAEIGYAATLLAESVMWLALGSFRRQPVHISQIARQGMEIGVLAVPIVTVLALAIGVMLAIQGIHSLRTFGAEARVTTGIALSVFREFGPLITAVLVAGRSGSALTARIGTMRISQEIDALRVMGIAPVRYLVSPALVAMLVMLPLLTFWSEMMAVAGAGLFVVAELDMSLLTYLERILDATRVNDVFHGLGKSLIFAVLVTLVGVVNGASVTGGAEGVGRATTRSVVQAISLIVFTDMVFAFIVTR